MEPTDKVLHESVGCLDSRHKAEHEGYEYTRRYFVRRGEARQCVVSVYEIPPGKSAYPYHYLDSGKLGVWGMGVNRVFRLEDEAGYYEGE